MCVEGRLKQETIQGRWFVDGKVPSIRMQVKWETFFLTSFLNNVIDSAKQKKFTQLSDRGAPPVKTIFSLFSGIGSP